MSSLISRTICCRSSRLSGVRSRISCSVTARTTRSESSSFVSFVKSSGPSLAMQAWWMRPFSSAYGSTAPPSWTRTWSRWGAPGCGSAVAAVPFVPVVLIRSWRPTLRPPDGECLPPRLRPAGGGRQGLRHLADRLREVAAAVREDERGAPVDRERHGAVARHLERDLALERTLDLARLHPDLRRGLAEHDPDPVGREREQLERLEREPDVLEGRHVERAEEQELVRAVE